MDRRNVVGYLNPSVEQPDCWYLKGTNWNDEKNIFNNNNINYLTMGYVYLSPEHLRVKIRNPNYEQIKQLKGNDPKMQYQYYYLRQKGLVKEFLKYFPEYSDTLLQHRKTLHYFTRQLYIHYVDCFIKKTPFYQITAIQQKSFPIILIYIEFFILFWTPHDNY